MSKSIQAPKLIVLCIILMAAFFLVEYAAAQDVPAADSEVWVGKMTGMANGDMKLFITRTGQEGDSSVRGTLNMAFGMSQGGYGSGTATCTIEGTVSKGILKAELLGDVQVNVGTFGVFGELIGTTSETQISGTWVVDHVAGSHSGEWFAEKMQ